MNKLRLIKFAVAIMTFLLIFGLLTMLTILYKRFQKTEKEVISSPIISLQQPQGSRIEQILTDNGHLHILIKDGGTADRILILNLKTQQIQQKITLN